MTTRQHMGCGYEAPLPAALGKPRPWTPLAWVRRGEDVSMCPGYLCSLPEVAEVTHAYPQWEAGTLTEWLDGEPPTRALLDALTARESGIHDKQRADLDEREVR